MLRLACTIYLLLLILVHPSWGATIQEICDTRGIPPKNPSIVISKSEYKLFFYLNGKYMKSYSIVLGKKPTDPKLYEGDNRTPEGIYRVKAKLIHQRWSKFILLDYPNGDDKRRYEAALKMGKIPRQDTEYPSVGGDIGIHGTHSHALNQARKNWTWGCISMFNKDINEIYPYVKKGMLVYILP